jgi:hypothetical protein
LPLNINADKLLNGSHPLALSMSDHVNHQQELH